MYNSVQELHLGIDLALQQLNSNRKQVLKPEEKDWFLNTTMLQAINNHIDPNASLPSRGSDSDQRSMDYLNSLKTSYKYKQPVIYDKVANLSKVALPADYYRRLRINGGVSLNIKDTSPIIVDNESTKGRLFKAIVPFDLIETIDGTKPTIADYTSHTKILINDALTVFETKTKLSSTVFKDKYNFTNIKSEVARFMMIPTMLEELNAVDWLYVYWENYKGGHYKNSFVFVIDNEVFKAKTNSMINTDSDVTLSVGAAYNFNTSSKFKPVKGHIISGDYTKKVKCTIVESTDFDSINSNDFFNSSYHSLVSTIEGGEVIVAGSKDFRVTSIDMVYYRKPKLINYRTNQSCEIDADDFKVQLVSLTAQKIDAFLDDENYQKVLNENIMLL